MIPDDLPDYVDRGGRQVWRPPYVARDVTVYGFVLPCDREAIDDLLHRDIVEIAGGALDYRCAQARVVVLFASLGRLSSNDPRDGERGYVAELEVSVWCLAADMAAGGRLVWYLPYVFVDSGQAAASGREVYGYPKQMGAFPRGFPKSLEKVGPTVVEAVAIPRFGPDAKATLHPMISAELLAARRTRRPRVTASTFAELRALFEQDLWVDERMAFGPEPALSAVITPAGVPPPPATSASGPRWIARRLLDAVRGRELAVGALPLVADLVANPTLLFLKQFRDVTCPTKACYQAVVEAPLSIHPLDATYEPLDASLYELTIEDWDSHPMASELGLGDGKALAPELAFKAGFAFDIDVGYEIWRAAT